MSKLAERLADRIQEMMWAEHDRHHPFITPAIALEKVTKARASLVEELEALVAMAERGVRADKHTTKLK